MNDAEKEVFVAMMAELQTAIALYPENADVSSPLAFCASVEHVALKTVVAAMHSWMLIRNLTQSMRAAETT